MDSNIVAVLITLLSVYFASSIWKTVDNYIKVRFSLKYSYEHGLDLWVVGS